MRKRCKTKGFESSEKERLTFAWRDQEGFMEEMVFKLRPTRRLSTGERESG